MATGEAEFLGGGGFDGDILDIDLHDASQASLHLLDVGIEFGAFGSDGDVGIAELVALVADELHGVGQENLTVDALEVGRRVGEVVSDVAHVGCSQQSIAQGMYQDIGIAVTQQAEGVFQLNAAQPKFAAFDETVYVVAKSNSYLHISFKG